MFDFFDLLLIHLVALSNITTSLYYENLNIFVICRNIYIYSILYTHL